MRFDDLRYDENKYPMIWVRKSTSGYCFTARIPCRVLEMTRKKIRIAALLVNGREKIHLVNEESIKHDPCECWGECKALDKFRGKIVKAHKEPKDPHAFGDTGTHKYLGCERMKETGRLADFWTTDCGYGCGCWMGASRSGGPPGIDPFGDCPKAPVAVKA